MCEGRIPVDREYTAVFSMVQSRCNWPVSPTLDKTVYQVRIIQLTELSLQYCMYRIIIAGFAAGECTGIAVPFCPS
jgi:hypothetical protein